MTRSVAVKLVAVLLVATLATPQAFACTQCCNVYSPCCIPQVLYDNNFDEACAWVFTGAASVVSGSAQLDGIGTVYQDVSIASGATDADLRIDLDVVPGVDPGTERLLIEVLNTSGVLLDTVDVLENNSADGPYDYPLGDYNGQTIRIRIREAMLPDPGDTVFRIDGVYLWAH